MLAIKIIVILAIVVFAVCMIPIGVDARYVAQQLILSATACGIKIKLFPRSSKKKSKEKQLNEQNENESKKKEKNRSKTKKPKQFNLIMSNEELFSLIRKVPEGIGKITGGIRVDRFMLRYVAGGNDPYNTAIIFGYINACLSALAPVCAMRFRCRNTDVLTDIDFSKEKTQIDFGIALSIRIGSVFSMVNTILFGALWILIKNKVRLFWYRHFNLPKYEELLIDESAATKVLRSVLLKKSHVAQVETEQNATEVQSMCTNMDVHDDKNINAENERKTSNGS